VPQVEMERNVAAVWKVVDKASAASGSAEIAKETVATNA